VGPVRDEEPRLLVRAQAVTPTARTTEALLDLHWFGRHCDTLRVACAPAYHAGGFKFESRILAHFDLQFLPRTLLCRDRGARTGVHAREPSVQSFKMVGTTQEGLDGFDCRK